MSSHGDATERAKAIRYQTLLGAVIRKRLLLLVRYPVNTLSQLVTIYALFAIVFFGGGAVAGPALADSLDGIIVGFFLFTLAIAAFSGLSWDITREAQWGTLEQLFMSPYGFGRVVATKVVVNVFEGFLWGAVVLVLMLLTTGRTLSFDVLTVVVLGVLTVASAVGVGFVFGGLAILYKRIENAFQLVQFAFIGLIAAPASGVGWLNALPLVQGSRMLQVAMQEGVALWQFPAGDLGLLVGTAVVYAGAGYYLFQRAQRRARRRGVLGHY